MTALYVREDLQSLLGQDPFGRAFALQGQVFRAVAGRRTVRFVWNGRAYFAKTHRGVGWREILKNLFVLRPPVIGARNEYEACLRLARVGIRAPLVAAFGERGCDPGRRESFVICDALEGFADLEAFTSAWPDQPPAPAERRSLVIAVAAFARAFHQSGLIHRDFYLCHLLLERAPWSVGRPELAVLDLHRARSFRRIPSRWRERDLAALLFSTLDLPLSRRSWYRFVRVYTGRPLREVFAREAPFWRRVERRALALYRKELDRKELNREALRQGSARRNDRP